MIEIKNVTKIYNGKDKNIIALDDVSLDLPEKGIIFLVGSNGSGKTTLMNIIVGIENVTSGEVLVDGKSYSDFSNRERSDYRNIDVGIVFQNFNLIDNMSVRNNLLIPLKIQDSKNVDYENRIDDMLKYLDLSEYADRKCNELSAGQKQRVAIARAMIKNPKIIFADEASGNLDSENTDTIMKLFSRISKDRLIVLISHDMVSARKYGDKIIRLSNGKIVEDTDNTKLKRISEQEYIVKLKCKQLEKKILLDNFDLKKEICEIAEWNGNYYEELKVNIDISYHENANSIALPITDQTKNAKSVGLIDRIKYMIFLNAKESIRCMFSIILISFISIFFLIGCILFLNDFTDSISKYMDSVDIRLAEVNKHIDTDTNEEVIRNGKEHFESLEYYSNNKVFKCITNADISYDSIGESDIVDLLYADQYKNFEGMCIEGNLPYNNNEVVVDNDIAQKNKICIGDIVHINNIKCVVCGILKENISNNQNVAIISKNIAVDYITVTDCINLQGIDVTKSASISDYVDGINTIGRISQFGEEIELIVGRKPVKNNEIIISDQLAEEIEYKWTDNISTTYRLPNLYDEKYGNKYKYLINLYDYIGRKVEVVGVYSTEKYQECGNIVFFDDIYSQIKEYYINYLNFDYCTIFLDENEYRIIDELTNDDYQIENDICSKIYYLKKIKDSLDSSFFNIFTILILMILVVLIFVLTLFINNHKHEIGILAGLGVRNSDIGKTYLMDGLIKCSISLFLSYVCCIFITNAINARIYKFIEVEKVDVLSINHLIMLPFALGIIVTGGFMIFISLKLIFQKNVVQLLKK